MHKFTFNVDRFSVMIDLWLSMHGFSNAELAAAAGIGVSTLYALKSGQYAPTMAQFTAICSVCDISPDTFFKKAKGS